MLFDPACHTIDVHNVALHTAKLAKEAGLPVDLPLVRAGPGGFQRVVRHLPVGGAV